MPTPSPARAGLPVRALLALLLVLVVPLLATPRAGAVVAPTGSITGRVTGAGAAVANVCVSASTTDDMPVGSPAMTNTNGRYTIAGLPTGDYSVFFSHDCGAGNWVDKTLTAHVTDGAATTLNATLVHGAKVTGHVTDAAGNDVTNACVSVETSPPGPGSGYAQTDGTGNFTVEGLVAGTYTVRYAGCFDSSANWVEQYYDGKSSLATATTFTLALGGTKVANATLTPGRTISGTVTGDGGAGLANICVFASDASGALGDLGGFATTTSDGTYTIGSLAPGSYAVEFEPCGLNGSYLTQYYDGAPDFTSATPVNVTTADAAGIDAQLEPGATITGHVADAAGNDLAGVCVTAYDADATGPLASFAMRGFAHTDSTGDYQLTGLPTGSYKVGFEGCDAGDYVLQFATDRASLDTANPISATAGHTTDGIDAALSQGGSIAGHVTDARTGAPVVGICVKAQAPDGSMVESAFTTPSGAYTLSGLSEETWKVYVTSVDCFNGLFDPPHYRPTYASQGTTVHPGDAITGVDASVVADSTAPNTTITSGPTGITKSADATFTFSAGENGVTYECALDGGDSAQCDSGYSTTVDHGTHTFTVWATDSAGNMEQSPAVQTWTVDPASNATSETTPAGGTVSGAPTSAVSAAVTTPSGGTVSIAPSAGPATPDPTGWKVFGSQLQITAPAATAAGPLQLVFTIAKSSLPDGAAPADISVLRDGVAAADCAAPGVANPDPCVSDRTVLGNGDLRITVLSVHASTWNLASVDAPAAPTTGGGTTPATTGSTPATTSTTTTTTGTAAAAPSTTAPSQAPSRTPAAGAAPTAPAVTCVVPSLKNKTLAQARKLLAQAHCAVGKVAKKANRKVRKGRVASQASMAKTTLPAGTRVNLVLSRGRR